MFYRGGGWQQQSAAATSRSIHRTLIVSGFSIVTIQFVMTRCYFTLVLHKISSPEAYRAVYKYRGRHRCLDAAIEAA